ncbi:MAG: VCBS repeat-containing protein [Planctomycetes bacterium]|nr:VCBS repeat-containing protein [Planctomycetota bacterium]
MVAKAQIDGDLADEIVVMTNNSMMTLFDFATGQPLSVASFPAPSQDSLRPCVGDVDGDGDIDLVAGHVNHKLASRLFLNDGTGHFVAGPHITSSFPVASSRVQFVADINNNGLPDLVLYDDSVRLRLGSLGFSLPIGPSTALPFARTLAVHDIDADGDLDILVSRGSDGRMEVIENILGVGNSRHLLPDSGYFNGDFGTLADVNGDGLRDIIVQGDGIYADTLRVVPGLGQGLTACGNPEYFVARPRAFADLDGDGDIEFVGPQVVLNRVHTPATKGQKRQYGSGKSGSGGFLPQIGATGPFSAGGQASVTVSGGVGMLFAFGLQPSAQANTPLPDLTLLNSATSTSSWVLGGAYGVAGAGTITLPYTIPAIVSGLTPYHQALLFDPGAPGYVTATGGLEISYP